MCLPVMSLPNEAPHIQQGRLAEQQALNHLKAQGLKLICQNYRCPYGELDLVMQDHKSLVIVEVRFRKSDRFGSAIETINRKKQSRIIAATKHYLYQHPVDCMIRFDVVAITGDHLEWIQDAFQ
jgi:putative endonuclease